MSAVTGSRVGRASRWQGSGRQGVIQAGVGPALPPRVAAAWRHDACDMSPTVTVRSRAVVC